MHKRLACLALTLWALSAPAFAYTQLTEFDLGQNAVYLDAPGEYHLCGSSDTNAVEIVSPCTVTVERLYCPALLLQADGLVTVVVKADCEVGVFQCAGDVLVTSWDGFGGLTAGEYAGSAVFAHCFFNGVCYGCAPGESVCVPAQGYRSAVFVSVCRVCGKTLQRPASRFSPGPYDRLPPPERGLMSA